jgi:hypothetical protein
MNPQIVRLTSGEEILCDHLFVSSDDDGKSQRHPMYHILKKPLVLIPERDGSMGFMQWMPYTEAYDQGVEVADSFVGFVVSPSPEVIGHYKSHVTGIITPPDKKPLLTTLTTE